MSHYSTALPALAVQLPPRAAAPQRREFLVACAIAFVSTFAGVLVVGGLLHRQAQATGLFAPPPTAGLRAAAPARLATARRAAAQPDTGLSRREALFGAAAAAAVLPERARAAYGTASGAGALANAPPQFERFYGAAGGLAGYGGGLVGGKPSTLGGVPAEKARYGYETNVATWKEVQVEGLDKGVGGIDSKWAGPGSQRAFCITRGPVVSLRHRLLPPASARTPPPFGLPTGASAGAMGAQCGQRALPGSSSYQYLDPRIIPPAPDLSALSAIYA